MNGKYLRERRDTVQALATMVWQVERQIRSS